MTAIDLGICMLSGFAFVVFDNGDGMQQEPFAEILHPRSPLQTGMDRSDVFRQSKPCKHVSQCVFIGDTRVEPQQLLIGQVRGIDIGDVGLGILAIGVEQQRAQCRCVVAGRRL